MFVAELADATQVSRRLDEDPAGPLDERLDDHRRGLLAMAVEQLRKGPGIAGRNRSLAEEERLVGAVEEVDAAD